MGGTISQPDFVELVERAGLTKKESDYFRLFMGIDGPPLPPNEIASLKGIGRSNAVSGIVRSRNKLAALPFCFPIPTRVRRPKVICALKLPTMMTQKMAEKIIAGPVAIGEFEGGYVRVACYDPFGEVISETGRNIPAALSNLVNANYKRAREFVFKRDKYRCTNCGKFEACQADHVKPRSQGRCDHVDNLKTLCDGCHKLRHKVMKFHQEKKKCSKHMTNTQI